jgi:hypothetical protein
MASLEGWRSATELRPLEKKFQVSGFKFQVNSHGPAKPPPQIQQGRGPKWHPLT